MDVSLYRPELDRFLALLNQESPKILDIACGPGNITNYVLSKKPTLTVLGIDLAPNMIELAKANCPEATFKVMDCRHITSINELFDGIVVGFYLPYLNKGEVKYLFKKISNLLRVGGVLYLSAIEADFSTSGYKKGSTGDQVFMYYYQLEFIEAMLSANNLKIISVRRNSVQDKPNPDIDLLILAVKRT